jgi:hypothetical protein
MASDELRVAAYWKRGVSPHDETLGRKRRASGVSNAQMQRPERTPI